MKNKNKHNSSLLNGLLYGLASLVAVVLIASVANGVSNGNMFKGSVLSLFNKIGLTDFDNARPDVGIEYVSLRKTTNPSDDFDYYKYQTTLVVRNYGEVLTNGSLVISAGENQKTAFILHKYDDLPYVKIAEIMNVSVSSVESLLFRARKKLQKKLHDCYKKLHS